MAGLEVTRQILDMKAADAVLSLRDSLRKVESIAKWLANNPVVDTTDPLVANFGYTSDEAYLIRVTFEQLETIRLNNLSLSETARKLTGLEV